MERRNFYDSETYDALVARIGGLTAGTAPEWGSMNSAQMLSHCAEVAEVAAGKELIGTPWFVRLIAGMIKRMVLSDKPYPHNSKTHPQYVMTAPADFDTQKARLLEVLAGLKASGQEAAYEEKHPLFGRVTPEEAGWAAYKHLDHHLRQFGA